MVSCVPGSPMDWAADVYKRQQHGGAKGGGLVEVVDQFRRGAVLEGDVFHVERGVGAALGVPNPAEKSSRFSSRTSRMLMFSNVR